MEIKKKEARQTELDLQKKRAELEKLKVALQYQETAHAININLQADVLFDLGKAEIRPEAEAALNTAEQTPQCFGASAVVGGGTPFRARPARRSHHGVEWVQRYALEMERRLRSRLKPTTDSWRVDLT